MRAAMPRYSEESKAAVLKKLLPLIGKPGQIYFRGFSDGLELI
jgi:hypothetical protein